MFKINFIDSLGYLAILIIALSLFSLGMSFTGRATDSGIVNITIANTVSINFTIDSINFGSGSVNLGSNSATIDTLGNVVSGNWTPVRPGFVLENIGNTNVTLDLKSGKNAEQFLGGTNSGYFYRVTNNKTGSCVQGDIVLGTWNNVNIAGDGDLVCDSFGFALNANAINIDIKLVIPSDARIGVQSDIFTATGTAI